jgi:hypothetical protein
MRHRFRLGRGARWLPALGATMALAAVAPSAASASGFGGASPGFDPEATNTPYLAWTGETVRLEKCIPNVYGLTSGDLQADGVAVDVNTEAWTGDQSLYGGPQFGKSTEKVFISHDYTGTDMMYDLSAPQPYGGICAEADVEASSAGLARIQMDVNYNTGATHGPVYLDLAHEFYAGWMTLNQPSLTGGGSANAGGANVPLDVKVTGTIPLNNGNSGIAGEVGQSSLTMPNDWALMASKLAVDWSPNNGTGGGGNAADDWDTSGEPENVEGHSIASGCTTPDNPLLPSAPVFTGDSGAYVSQAYLDNGDNCNGGGETGPFSTSSGLSSADAIGPFDQTDPVDTFLPNGDLNAADAPMPAALVDVAIAQNPTGQNGKASIGSLTAADKTAIDSRDGTGAAIAHNLYSPFYDAYIPATARPTDNSSGIDGAQGNDFTGFLDIPSPGDSWYQYAQGDPGVYHFWDTADLATNHGQSTDCLLRADDPESGAGAIYRQTPSGATEVDVYTDQNGEAQVEFAPGTGAYYDNLGADENLDGGCDLENLPGGNTTLGTASITATAEYPYKPVDYPQEASTPVSVKVNSLFAKDLSYVPKGTSEADNNARIVISHAQDVDGTPFANEIVCFSPTGSTIAGVSQFTGSYDGVSYAGATPVAPPDGFALNTTCLRTDGNGNAAIEVLNSEPTTVDVVADYVNEGLLRDLPVDFTKPSGGATPPQGGGDGGSSNPTSNPGTTQVPAAGTPGTTAPTAGVVATINPTLTRTVTPRRVSFARVQLLRLLTPARGSHYLVVRVHSSSRTARIRMTLQVHRAGRLQTIHRTLVVRTNRTVKLRVARSVAKIKGARLVR